MGFQLHLILQFLPCLTCAQESEFLQMIKYNSNETAVLGENTTIFCNLTAQTDVAQITWQKIRGSLSQNIGTYSNKYGAKILPPYVDRLHCKVMESGSSFIMIQEVALEDEACYKCLFNVFPHGSHGGQTCLNILIVPELTIELESNSNSEDDLRFIYSATGKPAPRISLLPSQVLANPPEEHFNVSQNSTVTIIKKFTVSLKTVRSLGLQHLIVYMDHPQKREDRLVPLPVQPKYPTGCSVWIPVLATSTIILFISHIITVIYCIKRQKKKRSWSMRKPSTQEEIAMNPCPT